MKIVTHTEMLALPPGTVFSFIGESDGGPQGELLGSLYVKGDTLRRTKDGTPFDFEILNMLPQMAHSGDKRIASMYGDDVEDIDEENALDQQRAMRLGLKYDVYPGLEGLDFNAILQSTLIEDELEKLDGSGAADPGSIMSAG